MYIARRTGAGRGVYEVAGTTASGLTPADLVEDELVLELTPETRLPTGVSLFLQGGKHRLKRTGGEIQIQRQMAAVLMLPSPRRADAGLGNSTDVARTKEYVVDRIQLEFVNPGLNNQAFVVPDIVEVKNATSSQQFSVDERFAAIEAVWAASDQLPEPLRTHVKRHQSLVTSGNRITAECETTVARIQGAVLIAWPTEAVISGDPLVLISRHLQVGVPAAQPQAQPMSIAEFTFEGGFDPAAVVGVPERVRRAIIQRRGQRSFRQALMVAYGGHCQVTDSTGEPALEAAHIFPYAEGGEYTNDPRNGLLLRADIHVLFDLGLVRVLPNSLTVRVMPPLQATTYGPLDGTILKTGAALKPSDEALQKKLAMYG